MSVFASFNSNSGNLVDEIEFAKRNPIEISRQHRRFVVYDTVKIDSPLWDTEPVAALLQGMTQVVNLGAEYDYLPDKLSFVLYGTHELWPILLRLNEATHRADFRGPMIKIIGSGYLNQLLKTLEFGRKRAERADGLGIPVLGDLTIKRVLV